MDIDNSDIDFISGQFRSMNTNDKDYLIGEFKRLSKTQLSDEGCIFYLDLAEWNLNTALWAYYEYETSNAQAATSSSSSSSSSLSYSTTFSHIYPSNQNQLVAIPQMKVLTHVTYGHEEPVQVDSVFTKTWRISNNGNQKWPSDCTLKYVSGYNFKLLTSSLQITYNTINYANMQTVSNMYLRINEQLEPNESMEISLELKAPDSPGMYQCELRLFHPMSNQYFGDPLAMMMNVVEFDGETGVMDLTHKLNNVNMFGNANRQHSQPNVNTSLLGLAATNSIKLDNNSNVLDQLGSLDNTSPTSNTTLNNYYADDEKRPDFYDDMFS